jgi:hypothetical protein
MPETPLWDELTRSEQRPLIRLFVGLVDNEQKLSVPGLLAPTLAMRRQKADALRLVMPLLTGYAILWSHSSLNLLPLPLVSCAPALSNTLINILDRDHCTRGD